MNTLFGTDGIRGMPGYFPLDPPALVALGKAFGAFLGEGKRILVGRDTRQSGEELTGLIMRGLKESGCLCENAGILPTPAISWLTRQESTLDGAVVISASHNPWQDNGVKFFNAEGTKLTVAQEEDLTSLFHQLYASEEKPEPLVKKINPYWCNLYFARLVHLLEKFPSSLEMVVMDGAHGATSPILRKLSQNYPQLIYPIGVDPNGTNINAGVGSQHPEHALETMKKLDVPLGFAFDGDGDRLVLLHQDYGILDGDALIYGFSRIQRAQNLLGEGGVVLTVLNNQGLEDALKNEGISVTRCEVGDRHVWYTMEDVGATLGGETSGHIIQSFLGVTGDGLVNACFLLAQWSDTLLQEMVSLPKYPQKTFNLKVPHKPPLENLSAYWVAKERAEKILNGQGRTIIRYSGTEPKLRLMVESPHPEQAEKAMSVLVETFLEVFGEKK